MRLSAVLWWLLAWALLSPAALAAPTPAKKKPAATSSSAAVVAMRPEARAAARALARLVYRDAQLRPRFDEASARALMGEPPAETAAREVVELSEVVASLAASDDAVRRRLLAATGKELGVALVVLVDADDAGASARVLRVSEQRFLGVTLAPKASEEGDFDWRDGLGMLRGLVAQPAPGPRRTAAKPRPDKPVAKKPAPLAPRNPAASEPGDAEADDDQASLLTSPWFWGGLGVVVSVGVTVLVLSQTAFKEPDIITLEGRVSP
jgi:hypothetical protein